MSTGTSAAANRGAPGSRRWRADDDLPYLLAHAAHEVSEAFHSGLRAHDMTVLSWRVLAALTDGRGFTVTELAGHCLAKQPTVSKLIDRLVRERWVRRRRDRGDRRRGLIEITGAGRRKVAPVIAQARAYDRSLLEGHSPEDLERLRALLRALIRRD